jgi:hypothetical protein
MDDVAAPAPRLRLGALCAQPGAEPYYLDRPVRDRAPGSEALRRMTAALRPGGWLLVEDFDVVLHPLACPGMCGPQQHRANRLRTGFRTLLAERGVDLEYGRNAAAPVARRRTDQSRGRRPSSRWPRRRGGWMPRTSGRSATGWSPRGLATREEIDGHLAAVVAGRLDIVTPPLVSARGRRR